VVAALRKGTETSTRGGEVEEEESPRRHPMKVFGGPRLGPRSAEYAKSLAPEQPESELGAYPILLDMFLPL